MKTILFSLLQVILASGILYGYYHLMLRNKKFHRYNRFYLLGAAVVSVLIPFLNIPVYFAESEIQSSVVLQTLQSISSASPENEVAITSTALPEVSTRFNWNIVLYSIYVLAVVFFIVRIFISLKKIRTIIKNNTVEELEGVRFVNTIEPGTPYSFFRWLFWNKKIELRSEKGEQIFRHEIYHIQQKHSADIIMLELLTAFLWINPFFHLMKKEIKAIHEFLADRFAAHKTEKWEYAELLLMQAFNTQQQLVNPFFHNQIKRRIAMITNPQKTSHRYLRKLLVLPVAAMVVALFAFSYKKKQMNDNVVDPGNPLTIVIDAAHGGTDAGVISPDKKYTEAKIALEIAQQIQKLAKEYNINVVMTREDDRFPGNAASKEDGLKKRVEIANEIKPDAFIAIHVNGGGNTVNGNRTKYSGIEAYVSDKREDVNGRSLASAILNSLSPIYKTTLELKQRKESGVYVLDHNSYPAVLLECGYINNSEDLAFIINKDNQEKIATSILTAITEYHNNHSYRNQIPIDTVPVVSNDELTIINLPPPAKKAPAQELLKTWTDAKIYGVWLDGKRINNNDLAKYKSSDFGFYSVSKLAKNAINYGKHYYQVDLMTHNYYDKTFEKGAGFKTKTGPDGTISPFLHSYKKELIVINGTVTNLTINEVNQKIKLSEIERINVIKDVTAISKYGEKGKNGVIEIITKQGSNLPVTEIALNDSKQIDTDNIVFEKVEIEPSFPGGEATWKKYLERNLNASIAADHNAPPGEYTVYIQFVVHTDGHVSDVKALTNHDFGMEKEASRVIREGPKWLPAIQNGKPVNANKKQPINFTVPGVSMLKSKQTSKISDIQPQSQLQDNISSRRTAIDP